jgi:hypothetical protein
MIVCPMRDRRSYGRQKFIARSGFEQHGIGTEPLGDPKTLRRG